MEPWVVDLVKNYGGVIIGWVLGLASTLGIQGYQDRKRRTEMRRAIALELREVTLRLLVYIFLIESRFGNLNRELLE